MTKGRYDNTNSGAIFKKTDKETDKSPDYSGELNAAGVDYWLSGWVKVSKKDTRFISIRLKSKKSTAAEPDLNDEIPF